MARLSSVLNERQVELRGKERQLLTRLSEMMTAFGATPDDTAVLRQALTDLDEMFLLVVVGEFNAGKSAFINALLGERVLEEGVTPTTSVITLLRYGDTPSSEVKEEFLSERRYPSSFLREISIVDTPGTNAIIRRHEEITNRFAPRSDLVLFVTSADRPFTESERAFLERLRAWGKKIVVVLNKVDLLASGEVQTVLTFIQHNAQALLGFSPETFPVSGRRALEAKRAGDSRARQEGLEASGFAALESYITDTLDEESRVRLKLLNPLGVAEDLAGHYLQATRQRTELLRGDLEAVANIDAQLGQFRRDMERDVGPRIAAVETIVYEMGTRGTEFFDQTLRLGRVFDLANGERVKGEFTRQVLADSSERIDEAVQELIDWMVSQELRLWQGVMDYVARRRQTETDDRLIGQVGGSFDYDRRELLQTVSRTVRRAVDSFDRQSETAKLTEEMRAAVAQTTLAEVGAVGLGAIGLLIGGAVADVTGILAFTLLAGLGLYIIPTKRKRAQREFAARMEELRGRLTTAMKEQFARELQRSVERINDAVTPYGRFVRTEATKFERFDADFSTLRDDLGRLRKEVGG
ncbi:MAG: dynamin family protein [Chloroflexota bacterium]